VVAAVAAWRDRFAGAVELAVGNHDRRVDLPAAWRIRRRCDDEPDGPFRYVHDPEEIPAAADGFVWCGHLHPTVRLSSAVDRLVLPCFLVSGRRAILPAFTAFARGPGVRPEADDRVFATAAGEVIEVAHSAT
jgi:metallophosphoesterase superfamily enzyme